MSAILSMDTRFKILVESDNVEITHLGFCAFLLPAKNLTYLNTLKIPRDLDALNIKICTNPEFRIHNCFNKIYCNLFVLNLQH